jgi:hypothetical protein
VRRAALLFCALAVAGCGGSGGKATVTRRELPRTVLQPADVPRSWTQFAEGKQVRLDAHAGPRQSATRFGREEGWIARYRATSSTGPAVVESRADLFETVSGAKKDLSAYREELKTGIAGSGATPKLLPSPSLGDASVAGELRQGPAVFLVVAWRRSNATASVTVEGQAASTHVGDVLALARRQDRRLERAAGK